MHTGGAAAPPLVVEKGGWKIHEAKSCTIFCGCRRLQRAGDCRARPHPLDNGRAGRPLPVRTVRDCAQLFAQKHRVPGGAGRSLHHCGGIRHRRGGKFVAWVECLGLYQRGRGHSGADLPAVHLLLVLLVLRRVWGTAAVVLHWQPGKQEFWGIYLPLSISLT